MKRYLVGSDIHWYVENVSKALKQFPSVDGIILAGDYERPVGEIREQVEAVTPGLPFYAVRGNNDFDDPPEILPEELVFEIGDEPADGGLRGGRHRILLVHGHRYMDPVTELSRPGEKKGIGRLFFGRGLAKPSLVDRASAVGADIVIFGHTHSFTRLCVPKKGICLFNPGCMAGEAGEGAYGFAEDDQWGTPGYGLREFGILEVDGGNIRFCGYRLREPEEE